jgi:hypothetical protein
MSWKLRTETDLSTGQSFRTFICFDEEGQMTGAVGEGDGLELVKELLKTYPQAIEVLLQEIDKEQVVEAQQPPPTPPPQPQPQQPYQQLYQEESPEIPRAPMAQTPSHLMEEEEDVEDTPLRIPGDRPITLQSMAPKIGRDVPQG